MHHPTKACLAKAWLAAIRFRKDDLALFTPTTKGFFDAHLNNMRFN
jgi:hypothetical protein